MSRANAQLGWRLVPELAVAFEGFNLFDTKASDIGYFYTPRLPGEVEAGVDDIHTHPAPRPTPRVRLSANWPSSSGAFAPPTSAHPH